MNMFSQLRIQTMQKNIKVPLTILNFNLLPEITSVRSLM